MSKIEKYIEACNYPGILDQEEVEKNLYAYIAELKINRKVVRLERNWDIFNYNDIVKNMKEVLKSARNTIDAIDAIDTRDAIVARDARNARDARDARNAIDAIDTIAARNAIAAIDAIAAIEAIDAIVARDARNARNAIVARDARNARDAIEARNAIDARKNLYAFIVNNYWYGWELSWIATIWIGNNDNKKSLKWSEYIYNAFLSGCWFIYWTDTTVYWFAKPICKTILMNNRKILHCETTPALISDWVDLYSLNGVFVTQEIVMTPAEKLDPKLVLTEKNAEIRREIVRKIGIERVCIKLGAETLDKKDDYELLNLNLGDGRKRPYLKMKNPSIATYHLEGIPPEINTVEQALNWRNGVETNPLVLT